MTRSPPHRGTNSYRPDDRRRRSSDSRPSRRSRSRSPPRRPHHSQHYNPRRSPRPHLHDSQHLPYDDLGPPPLPDEAPPPLPTEAPPPFYPSGPPSYTAGAPGTNTFAPSIQEAPDDGWDPIWDPSTNAYYFYNRFSGATQWENPRLPDPSLTQQILQEAEAPQGPLQIKPAAEGGYNPAIHGDYDPNADYALRPDTEVPQGPPDLEGVAAHLQHVPTSQANGTAPTDDSYAATATFNRFTGRFQTDDQGPGRHSDDAKSKRQMNAFFDVDAAANAHDGRSLRAERQQRRLTKEELKAFRSKAREKKETKRRAWLRD